MLREVHGHPQLYIPQAKDAGTSIQRAYECEVECCGHAAVVVASRELTALREEAAKKTPNAKKSTGSFESAEGSKGKTVRIGTTLSSE